MIFTERVDHTHSFTETLTLAFEMRQKARLKISLDSGIEAGLMLPRGLTLRGGDRLRSKDGVIAKIIAAEEDVSVVKCLDKTSIVKSLLPFRKSSYAIAD